MILCVFGFYQFHCSGCCWALMILIILKFGPEPPYDWPPYDEPPKLLYDDPLNPPLPLPWPLFEINLTILTGAGAGAGADCCTSLMICGGCGAGADCCCTSLMICGGCGAGTAIGWMILMICGACWIWNQDEFSIILNAFSLPIDVIETFRNNWFELQSLLIQFYTFKVQHFKYFNIEIIIDLLVELIE